MEVFSFVVLALIFSNIQMVTSADNKEDGFDSYLEFIGDLANNRSLNFNISRPIIGCTEDYQHNMQFSCQRIPSNGAATSVHRLRPSDVNVVAALGDSLTAAFGAESCTLVSLAYEFRGRSWSVGGDDEVDEIFTLPNILKFFNPDLKGFSVGVGDEDSEGANMNVAFVGARAEHMPSQAETLVQKMKADPNVDIANDWKMVTIFIGGNDLCLACRQVHKYSAEQYTYFLQETLDILHRDLPRSLVNVVAILKVSELEHFNDVICKSIHLFACPCIFTEEYRTFTTDLTRKYQDYTEALIKSGRYDTRDDFTVVYQPFLVDSLIPRRQDGEVDKDYFAPDCFHLSSLGHSLGAKELWNNIMTPVGQKNRSWDSSAYIACPSEERPFIATNLNSLPEDSNSAGKREVGITVVTSCLLALLVWSAVLR